MKTLIFLSTISLSLFANMGPQGFHNWKNQYFVETGSYMGDGIQLALDAGFEEIHSLEIDGRFAMGCQRRYKRQNNVHIHRGNSACDLTKIIAKIDKPITFWLDGHRGVPDPKGGSNTPLLHELDQIKDHPIKTHTILIDDMHCCNTILFDYITRQEIMDKIYEINPDYKIIFEPGGNQGEYPHNVLAAYIEK